MYRLIFIILLMTTLQLEALPQQVLIIRHAEKSADNSSLSLKGKERAAALVPFFMETKELIAHGTPVAIYSMQSSKDDASDRAVDTIQSLADKLKVTVNTKFARDDYKKMVDEIKADASFKGKTVLICWEQTVIPEIARAFGALQTPGKWQQDVYDRVWKINFNSGAGRPMFQNSPQRLLYGDTSN